MYSRKLYRWADNGTQNQQSNAAATAARHNKLLDFGFQSLKVPFFLGTWNRGNRGNSSMKNHQR